MFPENGQRLSQIQLGQLSKRVLDIFGEEVGSQSSDLRDGRFGKLLQDFTQKRVNLTGKLLAYESVTQSDSRRERESIRTSGRASGSNPASIEFIVGGRS